MSPERQRAGLELTDALLEELDAALDQVASLDEDRILRSFLTVIKDCGAEGEGLLSFPRPGMSVALDLPIRSNTQSVIDRLNEHVIRCGGRIYLTKDGFTRPDHFRQMEPRLSAFLAEKRRIDPAERLTNFWYQHYRKLFSPPCDVRWAR